MLSWQSRSKHTECVRACLLVMMHPCVMQAHACVGRSEHIHPECPVSRDSGKRMTRRSVRTPRTGREADVCCSTV